MSLNFIKIFGFYFDFSGIFWILIPFKNGKNHEEIVGSWPT